MTFHRKAAGATLALGLGLVLAVPLLPMERAHGQSAPPQPDPGGQAQETPAPTLPKDSVPDAQPSPKSETNDPERAMSLLMRLTGRWAPTDKSCQARNGGEVPLRIERGGLKDGDRSCRFLDLRSPSEDRLDVTAACGEQEGSGSTEEFGLMLDETGALTLTRPDGETARFFRCLEEA
ncbi:hypothetical protein J2R99_000715 [Rhodopseudomonas julia]|uniref:DUF3617 family protein n=1 Tax=Rhodopseudomonas julia TaxID=200617 RepID=A0ABU0C2X9_9BRAD|nr:hypothetical protein [Rhodopseudomonas julia]MDQ0324866.1 hypothetical protein [Rhodopseudomonas julia]